MAEHTEVEARDVILVLLRLAGEAVSPNDLRRVVHEVDEAELDGLPETLYVTDVDTLFDLEQKLFEDAEALHSEGLVLRAGSRKGPWMDSIITPLGWRHARGILKRLPCDTVETLQKLAGSAVRAEPSA